MRKRFYLLMLVAVLPATGFAGPHGPALLHGDRISTDTSLPYVASRQEKHVAASMVYFHLACVSARLRLYPLAMKLFLRSASGRKNHSGPVRQEGEGEANWMLTREEDSLLTLPTRQVTESKVEKISSVLEIFGDTANADHYAMMLQVKQPVFNKRKVFTGIGNVGHTFITLIRFNRDRTYLSRSFGFYPKKKYPLAASPFFPSVPGLFRDDAEHDWDEMAGRFISKGQFRSIIHMMERYAGRRYHLSKNNCTDFGLTLAALGGITVENTSSRWPFGKGNNPAYTGQSMLLGKVTHDSTNDNDDIFTALNHADEIWDTARK